MTVFLFFTLMSLSLANAAGELTVVDPLETWLFTQLGQADYQLLENFSPSGSVPGSVIASPSRVSPPYYFHWVRDASLVVSVAIDLYEKETDLVRKKVLFSKIVDFIEISRAHQLTENRAGGPGNSGLGEVRFQVKLFDGNLVDSSPWAWPQTDGPALRASAIIKFAQLMLRDGRSAYVQSKLYDGKIPTETVIKADLEFTAHHWLDKSFDIWEEVKGYHFYTAFVQRRALLDGIDLASKLGDYGAARFYQDQITPLENHLLRFWDAKEGQILATLEGDGRVYNEKQDNLDIAVILAVLHASATGDDFFSVTDGRVLATAMKLIHTFKNVYEINQHTIDHDSYIMGPALGRYAADRYNGYHTDGLGNPWILATNAIAELSFRARLEWQRKGRVVITGLNKEFLEYMTHDLKISVGEVIETHDHRFQQIEKGLKLGGDRFLRRVKYHANPDYSLAEQLNRDFGHQQGARDLTWSCASVITAATHRH